MWPFLMVSHVLWKLWYISKADVKLHTNTPSCHNFHWRAHRIIGYRSCRDEITFDRFKIAESNAKISAILLSIKYLLNIQHIIYCLCFDTCCSRWEWGSLKLFYPINRSGSVGPPCFRSLWQQKHLNTSYTRKFQCTNWKVHLFNSMWRQHNTGRGIST